MLSVETRNSQKNVRFEVGRLPVKPRRVIPLQLKEFRIGLQHDKTKA
jgi:hypothetical protein